MTLEGCLLAGNVGGAVFLTGSSRMENCVVYGNHGGAIYEAAAVVIGGDAAIVNCTISGNSRGYYPAGGLAVLASARSVAVTNSIVWGNIGPSVLLIEGSAKLSVTYSAVEGTEPWPGEGNTNRDPRFLFEGKFDFSNPGAFPPRMIVELPDLRLMPSSDLIDAGTPSGAAIEDIAGTVRPCGQRVDMGAYEHCPKGPFRRGDADGDGVLGLNDAVAILSFVFRLSSKDLLCESSADADDSGRVNITDAVYVLRYLFAAGPAPVAPFPACGLDMNIDRLSCEAYPACGV